MVCWSSGYSYSIHVSVPLHVYRNFNNPNLRCMSIVFSGLVEATMALSGSSLQRIDDMSSIVETLNILL